MVKYRVFKYLNNAFLKEIQEKIQLSDIINTDNLTYTISGEKSTKIRCFYLALKKLKSILK